MDCDVHHRVRANALKGKELIFGKRNLIDGPVPRHDQLRVQKEELLQPGERRVLVATTSPDPKALVEARLGFLLRGSRDCQCSDDCHYN